MTTTEQGSTTTADERSDRKTGKPTDVRHPACEFVGAGTDRRFVVRSHDLARSILRLKEGTEQAGFSADLVRSGKVFRPPMLYVEGAEHTQQRKLAGRYFTPRTVTQRHRDMIAEQADALVTELESNGGGRLDLVTFRLAMRVVAEVVGLTHSDPRKLEALLENFFEVPPAAEAPVWIKAWRAAVQQGNTFRFYLEHVRPAVQAHRRDEKDDVIGGLLQEGLRDRDLLIECLTYAAAGMVTTRQFMAVAAWHLIEKPELRARFRHGSDAERRTILNELVRLETVAGNLLRRTTSAVTLDTPDGAVELPGGTLVDLEIRAANADDVFGEAPLTLDPDRCPVAKVAPSGLSFGSGHHSCPGEPLALEETDLFLQRFFHSEWEVTTTPVIDWNDVVLAYDVSNLVVRRIGPARD